MFSGMPKIDLNSCMRERVGELLKCFSKEYITYEYKYKYKYLSSEYEYEYEYLVLHL